MSKADKYADMIIEDDLTHVVSETPAVYTDKEIRRIYEYDDGAVVEYEWQGAMDGKRSSPDLFNHRFTLTNPPSQNPDKLKKGVIKTIMYP